MKISTDQVLFFYSKIPLFQRILYQGIKKSGINYHKKQKNMKKFQKTIDKNHKKRYYNHGSKALPISKFYISSKLPFRYQSA